MEAGKSMVWYVVLVLVLLLIAVSIVPVMQVVIYNRKEMRKVEYAFPAELFSYDVGEFRFECVDEVKINRKSLQNSGSIRLSQGNILTNNGLESRKEKANSVELP